MKKLYLIRHAKSSWDNPELSDIERPLNKRGKRDAPRMGRFLKSIGAKPELMISSPAKRAMATAKRIAEEIDYKKKHIIKEHAIYHGSESAMLGVIRGASDEVEELFVFGHNPGFTDFANELGALNIDNIPTCGVVAFSFEVSSWKEVNFNSGKFLFFQIPRALPEEFNQD